MKKWTVFAVVALVVVVAGASITFARNGWRGSERKSIGWVEVLDLEDEQIEVIQSVLRKDHQEKLERIMELHKAVGSLRELRWSRDYTEDKESALIETMKSIREEMRNNHKSSRESISNELTEEQKEKFREYCGRDQECDGEKPAPGDGSGQRRGKDRDQNP